MFTTFKENTVYTSDLLRSFQTIEVRSDKVKGISAWINIHALSNVCRSLVPILEDHYNHALSHDMVLTFAGFSETLFTSLEQFCHEGYLALEDQEREYIQVLKEEFQYLEIPVSEEFWTIVKEEGEERKEGDDVKDETWSLNCEPESMEYSSDDDEDLKLENCIEGTMKNPIYKCLFCREKWKTFGTWRSHIQEVHPEHWPTIKGPYECKTCLKKMIKLSAFLKHQMPGQCVTPDTPFNCDDCGKTYTSHLTLSRHIKSAHRVQNVTCEICGISPRNKIALKQHMKNKHQFKEPVKCDECPKIFNSGRTLKQHKKFKHLVDKIACEVCGMTIKNRSSLYIHVQSWHQDPVNCDKCGKLFRNKRLLSNHLKIVHTDEDKKLYKCRHCGRGFMRKDKLVQHELIHTRDILFQCRVCDYKTVSKGNRKIHERLKHQYVHEEEKTTKSAS